MPNNTKFSKDNNVTEREAVILYISICTRLILSQFSAIDHANFIIIFPREHWS